ncbi:carbohydrate ABC transporter permease [Paenibacillus eucommiae]|uniref:Raffinose/stachyose/melibiose transport system permease protein n=1 Tax=Paenibacillus eucommiae TaxID=1355755 RepID=A0ABS4IPH5_9BACL|nr:sugar ABC transporter permease [Paenibacillus eucommiae]MBP1989463.1 raffinose/stachyose/melibiose transport system permease protein [Paenibacillus eucommiae]
MAYMEVQLPERLDYKPNEQNYKNKQKKRKVNIKAYLFLLPTLVMMATFSYYPALSAFYYSFTNWDGFLAAKFVGLHNFKTIFTTEEFRIAFLNLFWFALVNMIISITAPLLVALLIYRVKHGKLQNMYRLLFVFPLVVPGMVIILLWQFILNPDVGLMNAFLSAVGVPEENLPLWLGSMRMALPSLLLIGFPWVSGVSVLIYLAGFQSIPVSLREAAIMDGANGVTLFLRIELPLVVSQIKLLVILSIISVLQAFSYQLVLTNGGPANTTTVPGYIMYREAVNNSQLGFACAIGVVLFVMIFTLTVINNKFLKSPTEFDQH